MNEKLITLGLEINSTLTGIHSRSELTVKISRDYDRGRSSKKVLDSTFESDALELTNLQMDSGFTRISEGQLLWQDYLRPFSESVSGLRSGADLSRWYDTNSFYRKPSVIGKLSASKDTLFLKQYFVERALKIIKSNRRIKRKISILGPYSLASLAANEHYKSKDLLVHDFAKLLKQVLYQLPKLGISTVQINEPSLVYRYGESGITSKKELRIFLSAFEEYLSKLPLEVYLHTYFGDSSTILKDLLTLDGVVAIGVDFTQTSLRSLEKIRFKEKALACGCIDGRNSLIESPEWIADFCLEAMKTLKPQGLVILPSSELKYLPRIYADEKIKSIGKACDILQSRLV